VRSIDVETGGVFRFTHMRAFIYSIRHVYYRKMRAMRETERSSGLLIEVVGVETRVE